MGAENLKINWPVGDMEGRKSGIEGRKSEMEGRKSGDDYTDILDKEDDEDERQVEREYSDPLEENAAIAQQREAADLISVARTEEALVKRDAYLSSSQDQVFADEKKRHKISGELRPYISKSPSAVSAKKLREAFPVQAETKATKKTYEELLEETYAGDRDVMGDIDPSRNRNKK